MSRTVDPIPTTTANELHSISVLRLPETTTLGEDQGPCAQLSRPDSVSFLQSKPSGSF